ncbi:hypothetical protein PP175_10935 [Aneurinibacillus sp. Ricciae_BoGa-3]|uniref:hypothetical protein n=1 Tax=Aneurinibacillus sp. Ricciae_BoGa-3 TaxID=3022697 RepID=UPI002341EDD7|nr:hypothetical protein [Aneurinibacillus sp. Ricciae_BoGa-3]WCK56379.1 hypothetical protein PP175_10935 [Aneurinibacillus sp. Ricciae_BoGa-3]
MKKLLAAALLGASLLAINVGSASAATSCPFSNGAQNFAPNVVTSPFSSTNNGNLNNFMQQLFGKNNNSNGLPAQLSTTPVQQSNCPLQQSNFPVAPFNCPAQ